MCPTWKDTDILPPWWRDSQIEHTAFSAYAYHTTAIDTFINNLLESDDPNDEQIQEICARHAGISLSNLPSTDMDYIVREVEARWRG